MCKVSVGFIGGSGLYEMKGVQVVQEKWITTPFGYPSSKIVIVRMDDFEFAFLPRHGKGHRYNPSEVNYRANIYALKVLGVESLVGVSACGSLKEELMPGDFVICDQLVDYTKKRENTFFEGGMAAHVPMADPYCPRISEILYNSCLDAGLRVNRGGTYICIEGPQFSTRAESLIYRRLGIDVIGMTNAPEAKLAREAGICYSILACVTDYDVWYEGEGDVTHDMVIETFMKNIENVHKVMKRTIPNLFKSRRDCNCKDVIRNSLATRIEHISPDKRASLKVILEGIID
ncbi:MAG: methylthioadenosine phosphorylase [Candidatus Coatesbacteria bacterium 4484_99]|uniref:Purine nucleoside phosphorylase n=1 Tax=Candidatus Coatesbacteria bacterium 4484_99 TaxID=1970774 RepID=A0A1W9S3N1_9BACT|nr:MAG: methylthioadenosine phosphorylase [Candidatus Coatesbacteria bacterium 4484_99]